MAIKNRDLDTTEQRHILQAVVQPAIAGNTYLIGNIPYPSQLVTANISAIGISNTPYFGIWVNRFIGASGVTSVLLGTTLAVLAVGTSGGYSFAVNASLPLSLAGSSFPLQTGDWITLYCLGANSAFAQANVTLAIQALADSRLTYNQ